MRLSLAVIAAMAAFAMAAGSSLADDHLRPSAPAHASSPGFAPPGQVLFAPIVKLAQPGPARAARAVVVFDRSLEFDRKIAFHPEQTDELQIATARLPVRASTLIRATELYKRPDIPWSMAPPDIHYIAVTGAPRGSDFLYALAPTFEPPIRPQEYTGIFALHPPHSRGAGDGADSVIAELAAALRLDTFGGNNLVDAIAELLREVYGDLSAPWDTALGAYNRHDSAAMARFERDMPNLAGIFNRYFRFTNILDEVYYDNGPLVVFNLDAMVREDALKPYPHLYAFYRKIAQRLNVREALTDDAGHEWVRFSFDEGRLRIVFLDRAGMVAPMDPAMRPAGSFVAPGAVRHGHLHSTTRVRVRWLWMTFGLDNVNLLYDYQRAPDSVTISGYTTAVPRVVAPPVVRNIVMLLAGNFMERLAHGNGGRGMTVSASSARYSDDDIVFGAKVVGELTHSPALGLLPKVADRVIRARNSKVRREERTIGERFLDTIVADYRLARPRILALDRDPGADGAL